MTRCSKSALSRRALQVSGPPCMNPTASYSPCGNKCCHSVHWLSCVSCAIANHNNVVTTRCIEVEDDKEESLEISKLIKDNNS